MNLKKEIKPLIGIYGFTWILILVLYAIAIIRIDASFSEALDQLGRMISNYRFLIGFHILFLLLYILFICIRYAVRGYKNGKWRIAVKRLSFSLILPLLLVYGGVKGIMAINNTEAYAYDWDYYIENTSEIATNRYDIDGKHRGMSVFWSYDDTTDYQDATKAIIKDNIEWSTVIPFMYQDDQQTKRLQGDVIEGRWSRRDSSVIRQIKRLQERGIRVHLKPHVWLGEGWRSNIHLSEEDWTTWFDVYQQKMVQYARIATAMNVELFCIGTELRTVIDNKPDAWFTLIKEIKKVYTGKLTYALNWDDPITAIPFWDQLDYIGVQAYYPLTDSPSPELAAIKKGWDAHIEMLEKASTTYQKPILFTEVGYRSDTSATIAPWEWGAMTGILSKKKSHKTQQLAYEAMFQKLWDKPWFAGCYIWQWHTGTTASSAKDDVDFTPRYKPAENTITRWYGQDGAVTIKTVN